MLFTAEKLCELFNIIHYVQHAHQGSYVHEQVKWNYDHEKKCTSFKFYADLPQVHKNEFMLHIMGIPSLIGSQLTRAKNMPRLKLAFDFEQTPEHFWPEAHVDDPRNKGKGYNTTFTIEISSNEPKDTPFVSRFWCLEIMADIVTICQFMAIRKEYQEKVGI